MQSADSLKYFQSLWVCWTVMGVPKIDVMHKYQYYLYSILISLIGAVGYPLHLSLALFSADTFADNLMHLAITVIIIACTMKFTSNTLHLSKVREAEDILRQLDKRIKTKEERQHFEQAGHLLKYMAHLFLTFYFAIGLTAILSIVLKNGRSIYASGWFPFDWHDSMTKFYLACAYQIIGLYCHLIMNYVNDAFPPMALCILAEHLSLLGMRVSKLGYNSHDRMKNERELKRCIMDQKNLFKLFDVLQEILFLPMFIQFTVTAFNMCLSLSAMIFFVDELIDRIYYFSYFVSTVLQIFPACYFGSNLQILFSELHYDVYSSNWMDQSPIFKKHMIILTERSQKAPIAMAGGMFRIHLNFFFSAVKGTYSLFAIIMQMRN